MVHVKKLQVSASLASLAALALLSACAHERSAQVRSDVGLFFNQTGSTATLAYGRANSDAVGLVLQCEAGSRLVTVSDVARSASARSLMLISGADRSELAARLDNSTGQPTLWGEADVGAPALRGFRRSGRISVSSRGGGYALAARPEEKARVEQFFRACERI